LAQSPWGKVKGDGTIIGNVINEGGVAPGNSPGTLHIEGNYDQQPSALLKMQIAGTNTDDYDGPRRGWQRHDPGSSRHSVD
jgi:hypothetical protein